MADRRLRIGQLNLSTQMFIMIFVLSMVVFVPMSVISYKAAEKKLEARMTQDAFSLANLTLNRINAYIDNAQSLVFSILTSRDLSAVSQDELIAEFLINYARNNQFISQTIYYINPMGKVISNRQVYYDIMGNPMLSVLADSAYDNFGGLNWSQPYHSPLSGTTVAFVRPVESKTKEKLGVLIVELNLSDIKDSLDRQLLEAGRTYVLMTSSGNIVTLDRASSLLPFVGGVYHDALRQNAIDLLVQSPEGVSARKIDSRDLMVVKSQRNRLGWILYTVIDSGAFYRDLKSMAGIQISTTVIWAFVLLLFAIFISHYFSGPIRKLIETMSSYRNPEEAQPIPITRNDEIGRLAESYNQLLERIKNLVDDVTRSEQQKKRYELNMLQSQIQPHFLFNTLACISSLAKQNRIDEVRNTISSLVNLLSFTFDKPAERVYLSEEIEAVQMFFQIMKIRYGEIFQVKYLVSEEALNIRLPKLILQPIVENAIFCSIIPKHQTDGMIIVNAQVEHEHLVIRISDNGQGMNQEKIDQFLYRKINPRAADVFIQVGIINVDNRIRLYYGEQYGLSIASKENEGTCVSVIIPG
ncbi:hypothetical protein AGMMS49546_11030 [Spirochaetia bacterium]|nr:hypothetical protein AGMMS49546_11030 [Spirochaetia bacterium]